MIINLLGHGKGGYSYLAECDGRQVVFKKIHHEPCEYYKFGNKIEAERTDYARIKAAGINIDYYPTNCIVNTGLLWYVDYECNDYMQEWDFEHWGISHWR